MARILLGGLVAATLILLLLSQLWRGPWWGERRPGRRADPDRIQRWLLIALLLLALTSLAAFGLTLYWTQP